MAYKRLPRRFNLFQWFRWILACATGMTVAAAVSVLAYDTGGIGFPEYSFSLVYLALYVAVGAIVGAILGGTQWLVLGQHLSRPGWWVLSSAVGIAAGNVLHPFVHEATWRFLARYLFPATRILDLVKWLWPVVFGSAVNGAIVGIAQWLVLRRQTDRSGWWIVASTIAWPAGTITYWYLDYVVPTEVYQNAHMCLSSGWYHIGHYFLETGPYPWSYAILGAVVGIITGAMLAWLLNDPCHLKTYSKFYHTSDKDSLLLTDLPPKKWTPK